LEFKIRETIARRFCESSEQLTGVKQDIRSLAARWKQGNSDICECQSEWRDLREIGDELEGRVFESKEALVPMDDDDPLWKMFCTLHDRLVDVNKTLTDLYQSFRDARASLAGPQV
jgi:hypothetical protein